MTQTKKFAFLNALDLKVLAMVLMLLDHMWATIVSGNLWMTVLGRLAFPIFAFQIAEGCRQTRNFKKYLGRLFIFALISEIPFNLMIYGSWIFPFHQNVLFTFCIAVLLIRMTEKAKPKGKTIWGLSVAGACALGLLLGTVTMTDYMGYGVLTVLLFYFSSCGGWARLKQLAGMVLIHGFLIAGQTIPLTLFGMNIDLPIQSAAILALVPIWLYNGRQGPHNRFIQIAGYAFYPVHMLVLYLITLVR